MYVACRELKLKSGRIVKAGQPVPEAEDWDLPVLRSHLNLEWIKKVESESSPSLKESQPVSTSVDLTTRNHNKKKRK